MNPEMGRRWGGNLPPWVVSWDFLGWFREDGKMEPIGSM